MITIERRTALTAAVVVAFSTSVVLLVWMWTSLTPTSAAFAGQVVVEGNRLGAGELDIAVGTSTVTFAADGLAPGDRANGQLVLDNEGTLPLRYELSSRTVASALRDVIEITAWDADDDDCASSLPPDRPTWEPLRSGGDALDTPRVGRLAPGESRLICMTADLPVTAPTSVQGRRMDMTIVIDAVHDIERTTPRTERAS